MTVTLQAGFTSASALDAVYGPGSAERVHDAKVLVVGAGGVGCELVKNLAASGLTNITLIDLDTIDVSNLNRQFLFRKQHVGHSKAETAAQSVKHMVPGTNVIAMVGNVKEPRFGVPFFKKFNVVCNALDNLEARRHVNRMCLAAEVPLVESGSTGYVGQCAVIGKGFECYDCTDRPPQKTYAVCTIRSTPDKPVHCVVWAKFLYELVFGPEDEGNVLKDLDGAAPPSSDADNNITHIDNATETANVNGQAQNISEKGLEKQVHPSNSSLKPKSKRVRYLPGENPDVFATRVCQRVFVDDISQQRLLKDLWTQRAPPIVYDVNEKASPIDLDKLDLLQQDVWSEKKSASVLKATIVHIIQNRQSEIGNLSFDKDDRDALMFVASASNLRSYSYGVPLQSPFAVKGIAGNIVHAVATTNAIVGGLIVLEALKIVTSNGNVDKCLTTFVNRAVSGNRVKRILIPEPLRAAKKGCFVCSKGQLHISLDVEEMTLNTLVESVLKRKLSILEPSVHVRTGDYHNILYECGTGLEDDEVEEYDQALRKTLKALCVADGSELVVEDFAQSLRTTIHVSNVKGILEDKPVGERFCLDGELVDADEERAADEEKEDTEEVDDDSLVEVPVTVDEGAGSARVVKKSAEVTGNGQVAAKKRNVDEIANGIDDEKRETKRVKGTNGEVVAVDGE